MYLGKGRNFFLLPSSFPYQTITKHGERMNRNFLMLSFLVTMLSACMVPPTGSQPAPVASKAPALSATVVATEPTEVPTEMIPSGKLPAASFESRTYINETAGFALDYPAGWSVNEAVIGSRGSQVQFLSSTDLADVAVLPEDAARVSATVYQWDPKNDLVADTRAAPSRKTATSARTGEDRNCT